MTTPFRVALTFDAEQPDRPALPGTTDRLLDALAAADATATFFLQGRWVQAEPGTAARIAATGHLVGNHSHHHARLTLLTAAGIARDARAAEAAIRAATGADPRPWYRCPFGAGAGTSRVVDALARAGYRHVAWDVDGRDWAGGSARAIEERVVAGALAHGDGAVVLLHGWPAATPDAVTGIARRLRDAGARFVRVDELAYPASSLSISRTSSTTTASESSARPPIVASSASDSGSATDT